MDIQYERVGECVYDSERMNMSGSSTFLHENENEWQQWWYMRWLNMSDVVFKCFPQINNKMFYFDICGTFLNNATKIQKALWNNKVYTLVWHEIT
jgi:hypothetical protein